MTPLPIFRLALRSAFNRRMTALLTIVAVALSVMLFTGVEKIRKAARANFERTISGTDVIVGARSGAVNLLLYSVFHIGDATNNITWETYQEFAARPEIDWTIPISLGDSHRGFRVVGTTDSYFRHYRYGDDRTLTLASGKWFDNLFAVVVGAEVARALGYKIGDKIILSHGVGDVSFSEHKDKPFTVTGILAPTATPVDRSVYVSLQAIEAIHLGWQSGAPTALARLATPERVREMNLQPDQITAFFVGLRSKIALLRLQREINTYPQEPIMAVLPGVALTELWAVVGVVERALSAIAGFVIFVGLLTILTSILTSLNERRREMAILRSLGARPSAIFSLLVSESAALAFIGAILGIAAIYGAIALAADFVQTRTGFALTGMRAGLFDLYVVLAVTGAAALLGMLPAWRAFRNSLADGLTIRV
jgi:putative ABC transport system permease protein